MWSSRAKKYQRPKREVFWNTQPRNGDIQIIYEFEGDPGLLDPHVHNPRACESRYFLGLYNEGFFEPLLQPFYEFDAKRFLFRGYVCIEEEEGNTNKLCGLFRSEEVDQRPLFMQGYLCASLSFEKYLILRNGNTTCEWNIGYRAGVDDNRLKDGYVNTGRRHPSSMESIQIVKWLL